MKNYFCCIGLTCALAILCIVGGLFVAVASLFLPFAAAFGYVRIVKDEDGQIGLKVR